MLVSGTEKNKAKKRNKECWRVLILFFFSIIKYIFIQASFIPGMQRWLNIRILYIQILKEKPYDHFSSCTKNIQQNSMPIYIFGKGILLLNRVIREALGTKVRGWEDDSSGEEPGRRKSVTQGFKVEFIWNVPETTRGQKGRNKMSERVGVDCHRKRWH